MRTKTYKQLNQKEREKIYQLKKKGLTNSDIAQKLSRDKSTIGRELQRNQHFKLKHYLPDTAERKAQKRKEKGRKARYADKHPKLKRKGLTNSDIAQKLSRDKSTIGRELQRNQHFKLKHYLPDTAERKAQK